MKPSFYLAAAIMKLLNKRFDENKFKFELISHFPLMSRNFHLSVMIALKRIDFFPNSYSSFTFQFFFTV